MQVAVTGTYEPGMPAWQKEELIDRYQFLQAMTYNGAWQIYLFDRVPKYSKSYTKESLVPAKYYMADMGLRNAVLQPQSMDNGKALENIVFRSLNEKSTEEDKIFYFSEVKECDFVIQSSESIVQLIQVCWELTEENYEREMGGLLAASEYTGCKNCKIFDRTGSLEYHGLKVQIEAVWTCYVYHHVPVRPHHLPDSIDD